MNQPSPSNDVIAALQRAQRAHREGRFTTVEQECRRAIEQQPDNAEAWVLMSTVARHYQRLPEAVEMLRRAVSLKPENEYMQEALAELYLEQRDWRNAEPLYQRLFENRQDPALLHPLGKCAWGMGRYQSAIDLFQRAAEAQDAAPAVRISLAQAYVSLAQPEKAHAVLTALLKQHPEQSPGWMLLALLEFNDTRPERAIELMAHATRQPNAGAKTHQLYAGLLTLAGRLDAAKDTLRKVPQHPGNEARWRGFQYAMSQRPGARILSFGDEVLPMALDTAKLTGMTLEFGVYYGRSMRLIAERVKRDLHGFDSLQGLPEAWNPAEAAGSYSTGGLRPELPDHVRFHAGWFQDTLPVFFSSHKKPVRLAHIDCDLYSSTRTVLDHLLPVLRPGSILVFDDYLGYPGYEQHEFKAFQEFVSQRNLAYRYLAFGLLDRAAAVEITRV